MPRHITATVLAAFTPPANRYPRPPAGRPVNPSRARMTWGEQPSNSQACLITSSPPSHVLLMWVPRTRGGHLTARRMGLCSAWPAARAGRVRCSESCTPHVSRHRDPVVAVDGGAIPENLSRQPFAEDVTEFPIDTADVIRVVEQRPVRQPGQGPVDDAAGPALNAFGIAFNGRLGTARHDGRQPFPQTRLDELASDQGPAGGPSSP